MYPIVIQQIIFSYCELEEIPEEYHEILLEVYSNSEFIKDISIFKKCKKMILSCNKNLTDSCIKDLPRSLTY